MRQGLVGGVKKMKFEETSFMDGPLEISKGFIDGNYVFYVSR